MEKVAIINSVPWGSTGKIAKGILSNLNKKGYDAVFYYGRGNLNMENSFRFEYPIEATIHAFFGKLFGILGDLSFIATRRLIKELKNRKVDTVYLLSPHGYYLHETLFFKYVESYNVHLIYIMIDEYAYLGKCTNAATCDKYKTSCGRCPNIKKYPPSLFFDTCSHFIKRKAKNYIRTPNTLFVGPKFLLESSKESYLRPYMRMAPLDEAIDVELYKPQDASQILKEYRIDEKKIIVLCVADTTAASKGAHYFIEMVNLFKDDPHFIFIHIGYHGKHDSKLPTNFIPIPFVDNDVDVAKYYSMSDVMVFPSVFDTMSNTCLESLACGTPLICFNISGMPYLMDETVGTLVEPKSAVALADAVRAVKKKTKEVVNTCRSYALRRYDIRNYTDKLIEITLNDEQRK